MSGFGVTVGVADTGGFSVADVPQVDGSGEDFDSVLRGQLAQPSGAGMVGYDTDQTYPDGTVGKTLQGLDLTLRTDLADSADADKGAGLVAYSSALSYVNGTIGAEVKTQGTNLSNALLDLANHVDAAKGAGEIGFGTALDYETANPNSVGAELQLGRTFRTNLAATDDAAHGAGMVGFLYSLAYGAGTIGKWLKDLATSTSSPGAGFIGFVAAGASAVLRTVLDKLRDLSTPKDYSVDVTGVADSTAAMSSFITAGGGDLRPFGSTIKTTASLNLDISIATLVGKRQVWNCAGLAGAVLNVFSSQAYPLNDRLNPTSVVEGIAFVGNNTAGSIAVQVGHATYTNNNEITFRHCTFSNFETLVKFITNAWRVKFEDCQFFNCNSTGSGFFLNFPNGISANAGEVMSFTRCAFYDPLTAGTDLYLYSGQWVFRDCSFGGGNVRINSQGNAVILLEGCNLEVQKTSAGGLRMIVVAGTSTLNIVGGTIVMNGGGTTWTAAPIQVDGSAVCNISGLTGPSPNAQTTFSADSQKNLVQGSSPYVTVRGMNLIPNVNTALNFGVSSALNVLYNGDASQAGTNGWTGAGIANNAGTGRTGNSLRVTGAASPYQVVSAGFTPGQSCVLSLWAKVISGTGTAAFPRVIFLDRTGTYTVATVGNISFTNTTSAYTNFTQVCQIPAGTQQVWAVLDAQAGFVVDYDDVQLQFC